MTNNFALYISQANQINQKNMAFDYFFWSLAYQYGDSKNLIFYLKMRYYQKFTAFIVNNTTYYQLKYKINKAAFPFAATVKKKKNFYCNRLQF